MKENRTIGQAGLDPRLGALLREAYSESDARRVLPWPQALALVEAAPAVRPAWYQRLLGPAPRPLRYALAPLALLALGIASLAAIPAQSEVAGLVVLTDLPVAWSQGSPEFTDFEQGARQSFREQAPAGAELYILETQDAQSGRPQLALSMLHLEEGDARALYGGLQQRYPALQAFSPQLLPVESAAQGNLLGQLMGQALEPGKLARLDDAGLKLHVLKALRDAGLKVNNIVVKRQADGSAMVDVDAEMQFTVGERRQEDLEAAGLEMAP